MSQPSEKRCKDFLSKRLRGGCEVVLFCYQSATVLGDWLRGRKPVSLSCRLYKRKWSGWRDLNSRHPAPKAGALPDCATPRKEDLDTFSVKHFETNIFFCKCFTAIRFTFDNLWCREGEEKLTIKSHPPNLDFSHQYY